MVKTFIDTNVIVYANDAADPERKAVSIGAVEAQMRAGSGVISTQVLQEFTSIARHKLGQPDERIIQQLRALERMEVVTVRPSMVRRAVELSTRYQINFWDGAIIAAAESAHCQILWSEDLNAGQLYAGVRVENPLAA